MVLVGGYLQEHGNLSAATLLKEMASLPQHLLIANISSETGVICIALSMMKCLQTQSYAGISSEFMNAMTVLCPASSVGRT